MYDQYSSRSGEFERNYKLEETLEELAGILGAAEDNFVTPRFEQPQHPTTFVVGAPRSGTTLMMQWLANTGLVSYPSNFLSRFYRSVYIGARIQQMLFDKAYQYRDEMNLAINQSHAFASDIGKTEGALSPNVFWFFWRRFFKFGETSYLSPEQWQHSDTAGFLQEIAAMESVFDKPFATKALICNWNLTELDRLFNKALFIYIRRSPETLMQSIYLARERFRGDASQWWSFKPPEYSQLMQQDTAHQIAGLVISIENAMAKARNQIAPERWIDIDYEEFCANPAALYESIHSKMAAQGYTANAPLPSASTDAFKVTSKINIDKTMHQNLMDTYNALKDQPLDHPTTDTELTQQVS